MNDIPEAIALLAGWKPASVATTTVCPWEMACYIARILHDAVETSFFPGTIQKIERILECPLSFLVKKKKE
jgi:hypothetical protein